MHLEALRAYCLSFPKATEDIKWDHDLCFSVGGKMFCVASLEPPLSFSFKTTPDQFHELTAMRGITPAPYLARYQWVLVQEGHTLTPQQQEELILTSYALVKGKLSKKDRVAAGV
ncbi:MmcQ/YjbR family DNA-binding protein [Rufibacter quisquiliarum]|uniref:Putative DNA-binding protein (MmcQ/YjbR family) n=1 Tax=Rufibacter quisquiliarum TaxID=1549639 RepID=A0A839H100_9BACT|nr:MmcQ/YjbR family DNA-binding protein [Rufibacter quisquiliarum]MBA9079581.1 putative DNA-binding protein (MmcQ/YjbR family) [Rufibacter quisquiliarum]